ncbi:hypothetical protein B0H13DRAFT_1921518 [Mycena leptocephala]|nr:hypothetical protein B0H13DRAFT_1921518 [Mycena leptocephala]
MGRMRLPSLSLHGIEGAFAGSEAETVIRARNAVVEGNIDVEIEGKAVGENEWAEACSSEAWSWALFVAGSVARHFCQGFPGEKIVRDLNGQQGEKITLYDLDVQMGRGMRGRIPAKLDQGRQKSPGEIGWPWRQKGARDIRLHWGERNSPGRVGWPTKGSQIVSIIYMIVAFSANKDVHGVHFSIIHT